jgi:hypothetical protein
MADYAILLYALRRLLKANVLIDEEVQYSESTEASQNTKTNSKRRKKNYRRETVMGDQSVRS